MVFRVFFIAIFIVLSIYLLVKAERNQRVWALKAALALGSILAVAYGIALLTSLTTQGSIL